MSSVVRSSFLHSFLSHIMQLTDIKGHTSVYTQWTPIHTWYTPPICLIRAWYTPAIRLIHTWMSSAVRSSFLHSFLSQIMQLTDIKGHTSVYTQWTLIHTWYTPAICLIRAWYTPAERLIHTWIAQSLAKTRNPFIFHTCLQRQICHKIYLNKYQSMDNWAVNRLWNIWYNVGRRVCDKSTIKHCDNYTHILPICSKHTRTWAI